jgi:hypothetical protein
MAAYKKLRESDKYIIFKSGKIYSLTSNLFLSTRINSNRVIVDFISNDGKKLTRKLHRLLAEAFIPNPNNYKEIDHINRNPLDNDLSNLRWCSHMQNCNNKGIYSNNQSGFQNIHTNNNYWVLAINRQNFKLVKLYNKKEYTARDVSVIRDEILDKNNLKF